MISKKYINISLLTILISITVAVYLRMTLFANFPIYVMADSWEYLSISEDLSRNLNFFNRNLGEWRLPGYPLFLTAIQVGFGLNPVSIVFVQKLLGLGAVILGLSIGFLTRSRITAISLVLFLAINPIFLLNEHLIMTEGLFLFSLLSFSIIAIFCLRKEITTVTGIILGFSAIVTILIRSNGLFFCFPVIATIICLKGARDVQVRPFSIRPNLLKFVTGIIIGILLLFGPWLWRNFQAYNTVSPFTHNTNLNLLAYSAEHNLIDPSLPHMSQYAEHYNVQYPGTIYNLIRIFRRDIVHGEKEGALLLKEQFFNHPGKYLQEMGFSLFHFSGFPVPGITSGRNDTTWWFENMVINVAAIHEINEGFYENTNTPTSYKSQRTDTRMHHLWANTGMAYLSNFRAILIATFFIFLCIYLINTFHHYNQCVLQRRAILVFSLGYIFIVLTHSITLADYDRFAVPFDWIPLLIICLIMEEFLYSKIHPTP